MSLTTLANVKAFQNLDGTDHDAEIVRLIPVVEGFLASYCNRTLEQATVTEFHSTRAGQTTLLLKQPPVGSLTSLHDDPDRIYGADTLLATTEYVLTDAKAGIVRLDGTTFNEGLNNVKVVYAGGFAPGAAELKILEQAAIELLWLTRDLGDKALLGIQSRQIADGSVTVYQRNRLEAIREIVDSYRLRRV